MKDNADQRLTVRRRAAWPVALASGLAVVGVVALPTLLPDAEPDRDRAVMPVLPDPTGVDHAVEQQERVPAPRRITRVPNPPAGAATSPGEAPTRTPTAPSAAPAPTTTAPAAPSAPAPSTDPELPGPALAVRADRVPATVADLAGGELVEDAETWGDTDERYADFRLDGFATFVHIVRATGATPYSSCRHEPGQVSTCRRHRDGSVHTQETSTAPDVDGGATSHRVTWWTVDGWRVSASSSNAPEGKEAPPTRPEPGLSIEQLLAVTGSDAWFG